MIKFLVLTLYLLAKLKMAVISDPTIIGYFQEANFQKGIILVM